MRNRAEAVLAVGQVAIDLHCDLTRQVTRQHTVKRQIAALMRGQKRAIHPHLSRIRHRAKVQNCLPPKAFWQRHQPLIDRPARRLPQIGEQGLPWHGHHGVAPNTVAGMAKLPDPVQRKHFPCTRSPSHRGIHIQFSDAVLFNTTQNFTSGAANLPQNSSFCKAASIAFDYTRKVDMFGVNHERSLDEPQFSDRRP